MPVLLWRFRQYVVLGVCVVASVVLMAMGESRRVESARMVRSVVFYPFEKTLKLRDRYVGLERENRDLRLMVVRLVEANSRLRDAKAENERLRRMLGFRERGYRRVVPAEVIGWDESSVGLHLEVDQGSLSGVEVGHPAVSVDGLVGKVVEVNAYTSWLTTLLSPECAVSALDQRSRVRGIVGWRYPKGLELRHVAIGADVMEGDEIVSSGLGGVFPKGLRIGVVEEVEDRLGDLFRTIRLRPVADFDRLEEVAVLTGEVDAEAGQLLERARGLSARAADSLGVPSANGEETR